MVSLHGNIFNIPVELTWDLPHIPVCNTGIWFLSGVHGKKSNQHGNVSSYSRVPEGTIPVEGIKSFSWWCVLFQEFSTGTLLLFDWMPVVVYNWLELITVILSFIQTIIQPFPNRRQLPSCIPSWLEANIGRVFDPKESSGVQATWHGAMARARTHGQQKYVLLRCKTMTTVPRGPIQAISDDQTDGFST